MEENKNHMEECNELVALARRTRYQTECLAKDVFKEISENTDINEVSLDSCNSVMVSFDSVGFRHSGIAKRVLFNRTDTYAPSVSLEILTLDNRTSSSDFRKVKFSCVEDMLNVIGQVIKSVKQ